MLNEHGRVACASSANIFLVEGNAIVTPPEADGAMPGITRALLIEIAGALGVAATIEPVAAARIAAAPLVLTNSLIGVMPGGLARGAVDMPRLAMRLAAAYEERLRAELAGPVT
jgi:branched-chain amino acid aminotransferase